MKSTAFTSLLALVLFSGAVQAADATAPFSTGNTIELWGSYNLLGDSTGDADDSDVVDQFGQYGGKSNILFNLGSSTVGQLSTSLIHTTLDDNTGDDDQIKHGGQIAGHVVSTSTGLGLFAGIGAIDYVESSANQFAFGGAEYKAALTSGSMLIQVGYFDTETTNGDDLDGMGQAGFVRLVPSFALSDSVMVKLSGAYVYGDAGSDGETDMFTWGINLEKRLEAYPVTLIAGYDGFNIDNADGGTEEHEFKIGLRFDLHGTAPDTIDTPDAYRWVAAGQRLD